MKKVIWRILFAVAVLVQLVVILIRRRLIFSPRVLILVVVILSYRVSSAILGRGIEKGHREEK